MPDYARPILIHQPRRFEFGAGTAAAVGLWADAEGWYRKALGHAEQSPEAHAERWHASLNLSIVSRRSLRPGANGAPSSQAFVSTDCAKTRSARCVADRWDITPAKIARRGRVRWGSPARGG